MGSRPPWFWRWVRIPLRERIWYPLKNLWYSMFAVKPSQFDSMSCLCPSCQRDRERLDRLIEEVREELRREMP